MLRYVDRVLEGLPAGAKVLDLGCGTGEPIARPIAQLGYRVTRIDESREMLAIAREVLPEAELIHTDMVSIEITEQFAGLSPGVQCSM